LAGGTAILGDLGAEVIKIERPVTGDPCRESRHMGDLYLDLLPGKGSLFYEASNRNKKRVTVDLRTSKGQDIVHRLVAKADVFLTNMRPQAVEEIKNSYSVLRQINPELIYAKVSGFGPNGPDKDKGPLIIRDRQDDQDSCMPKASLICHLWYVSLV